VKRIKNPQTLFSLGLFCLAFSNIGSWVIRRHASAPFWANSGDFLTGLGIGASIALILLAFRMKNRAAC
jgi:hypothetical protein